ncbi:MAG: hypothetical protein ACKO7N_02670, partial [Candidatus Nitrosotenuis sp.]
MNIIVTCARHFETETIEEIRNLLSEVGDENPEVIISEFSGILYVNTLVDPVTILLTVTSGNGAADGLITSETRLLFSLLSA